MRGLFSRRRIFKTRRKNYPAKTHLNSTGMVRFSFLTADTGFTPQVLIGWFKVQGWFYAKTIPVAVF